MTTFKPGDKVVVVKDMMNTPSHELYMLKLGTVQTVDIVCSEGFVVGLKEFEGYRFHPDELQLIEGNHD